MQSMLIDVQKHLLMCSARVQAREHCRDGWTTISEDELAAIMFEFAEQTSKQLMKLNEHYANLVVDVYNNRLTPLVIQK